MNGPEEKKHQKIDQREDEGKIQWEINVPIWNRLILNDIGIALGIPLGIVVIIVVVFTGGKISGNAVYALGFIGAFLLIASVCVLFFFRGGYQAGFILESKGLQYFTRKRQAKRNLIINGLLVIIALFSGKPAVAGAGILAQSRQSMSIRWNKIKKVKTYPKSKSIIVRGGFAEKIALFCTDENYAAVEKFIKSKIGERRRPGNGKNGFRQV